jgi:hypothetical protein
MTSLTAFLLGLAIGSVAVAVATAIAYAIVICGGQAEDEDFR